jgi:hypothetical protein
MAASALYHGLFSEVLRKDVLLHKNPRGLTPLIPTKSSLPGILGRKARDKDSE